MRNSSSIHINTIMHKLWLPYSPKDLQKLWMYPWMPFNILALDEMLLDRRLYNGSMKDYIESKLDKELYDHFIILFWLDE